MGLKTPLYDIHVSSGAKIIDFGGWDMPLSYGSQLDEHRAVRRDSGLFDVSHMCVVDLTGARVREFLRYVLANDVAKLTVPGTALYSCMLTPGGGVIDDLIVYFLTDAWFRMVVNAGTRGKDLKWLEEHAAPFGVSVRERKDLAILAVQGPWRGKRPQRFCPPRIGRRRFESTILRRGGRLMVSGAHRVHGGGRLRDHAAGRRGRDGVARVGGARRDGGGPGGARHAAPRGRHESVRQRHG